MTPIRLTPDELQSAAQACRVAAFQCEQDGAKQSSPTVRRTFENSAANFMALANKLDAARKSAGRSS